MVMGATRGSCHGLWTFLVDIISIGPTFHNFVENGLCSSGSDGGNPPLSDGSQRMPRHPVTAIKEEVRIYHEGGIRVVTVMVVLTMMTTTR